jgi:hypothetical protein
MDIFLAAYILDNAQSAWSVNLSPLSTRGKGSNVKVVETTIIDHCGAVYPFLLMPTLILKTLG